jgi:hypothetical protein
MRLVDLRDMVANIVDYDPSVDTYRNQITNLLNDAYYSLFSTKPFTFAQKEEIVKAYADVSVSVTTPGVVTTELNFPAVSPIPTHWEGQIIEIDGTEYTIAWVSTTTKLYLTETPSLTGATTYSGKIKFRYLDLPQDCIAIMNVAKRSMTLTPQEPGMFTALARYEDEYYNLPLDEVNLPHYWIPADEFHLSAPRAVKGITPSTAGAINTVYVAMSYVFAGRESALSTATEVITTAANGGKLTITFDLLPNETGYYRKIYIRNPLKNWKGFRAIRTSAGSGSLLLINGQTATGDYPMPDFTEAWEFDSYPYTESDGTRQRIKLYPRQDADYNITVRYMYRPKPLVNDNDTPELPSSSHQMLAYMALKEIFVKLDNLPQANLYERKAAQEMIKLEQRYLTQIPRRFVKRGMVDGRVSPLPLYTPLTHS